MENYSEDQQFLIKNIMKFLSLGTYHLDLYLRNGEVKGIYIGDINFKPDQD